MTSAGSSSGRVAADVTDVRNPGREIDVAFTGQLDHRQTAAVSALLAHDDGVLVAPPGSGKTVMACAVIAERATSTLILVDRKALAEQWRTRIRSSSASGPARTARGARSSPASIDIAMLPSLARHDDVADLTGGYGQVIVDECHHLAAAAYDHSVRRSPRSSGSDSPRLRRGVTASVNSCAGSSDRSGTR